MVVISSTTAALQASRLFRGRLSHLRRLSSSGAVTAPRNRGAGLFQRLSSFLVGAGLTALATQFYLFDEVRRGNLLVLEKQKEIDGRLKKLEKK